MAPILFVLDFVYFLGQDSPSFILFLELRRGWQLVVNLSDNWSFINAYNGQVKLGLHLFYKSKLVAGVQLNLDFSGGCGLLGQGSLSD